MRIMVEAHKEHCKYLLVDVIAGGVERIIRATPLFSVLTALGIDKLCITSRKLSYHTQTAAATVEQFEQFRFNLRVLVPAIFTYRQWLSFSASFNIFSASFKSSSHSSYFDFVDSQYFTRSSHSSTQALGNTNSNTKSNNKFVTFLTVAAVVTTATIIASRWFKLQL